MAGGAIWKRGLTDEMAIADLSRLTRWTLFSLAGYLVVLFVLQVIAARYQGRKDRWWLPNAHRSIGLDICGWILGAVTVLAVPW